MTKIEKVYYENGIKITRIPEKKRKNNTVIKSSSRIQHQKGSFGSREPSGNGVSKIYDSIYDRKSRNGKEGKMNTKATQNRAW